MPTTGSTGPEWLGFDAVILGRMRENGIPGGAVAVARNGRLVYARGYGYADAEAKTPVEPTSLFRLASVSKPITGVTLAHLAQDPRHRLDLDTPVFSLLGWKPFLKPGGAVDPRLRQITVRHLLHHTGGWDRDKSGDLMFKHFQIAADMGLASPPGHQALIRWAMGQPLDFDPGQRYAYSNFGFCVLGRVVEKVTGLSYEQYVRSAVLAPLGIAAMRIGQGHRSQRFDREVAYYAQDNVRVRSLFAADGPTPLAYAFSSPQVMDAHGGWIASPIDLMRFLHVLNPRQAGALTERGRQMLTARPAPPVGLDPKGAPEEVYYGLGWQVRDLHDHEKRNLWHTGGMPGTATLLVQLANGMAWALLFNKDNGGDLDALMYQATDKVTHWPDHDLFAHYSL